MSTQAQAQAAKIKGPKEDNVLTFAISTTHVSTDLSTLPGWSSGKYITVIATVDCWILFGDSAVEAAAEAVTGTTRAVFLPASQERHLVATGTHLSVDGSADGFFCMYVSSP